MINKRRLHAWHQTALLARVLLACALLAGVLLIASNARAGIVFGSALQEAANTSRILNINEMNGMGTAAPTTVGPTSRIRGLAYDSNNDILYGIDEATDFLVTIDPATGATTNVVSTGFGLIFGLAFDRDNDVLYASDIGTDELLKIDLSNGTTTAIGSIGYGTVSGLAYDPNSDVLYGSDSASDLLITIETSPAPGGGPLGSLVGSLGSSDFDGLAYDAQSDTLYGSDNQSGLLYRINTSPASTVAMVKVGEIKFDNVEGLTAVPEPACFLFVGVFASGYCWCRKRWALST